MIFYSHSITNENGEVRGSKLLCEHIGGTLEKAINTQSKDLNFGIESELLVKMVESIVRFHDFGKYTSFFQNYLLKKGIVNGTLKQHARIGGITAYNLLEKKDKRLALISLFVIFRHHTQLCDILDFPKVFNDELQYIFDEQKTDIQKFLSQIENELGITELNSYLNYPDEREIRKSYRNWIIKDANIRDYFLVNYMFSILTEADKLDASYTGQYPLKPISENSVDNRFGKPDILKKQELFDLSNNEIRNLCRSEVVSNIEREDILSHKVLTLTAPTGIGKTMTALDFALKLKAKLKNKTGVESQIIYALPFINIIEQALSEYKSTLSGETKIIGHYQYADVFGKNEKQNNNDFEQNYNQKLMSVDTWQGDIVITSFVQFFETLIGHRNKLLKKFSHFANAIVILDEVQTLRLDHMPLIGAVLFYLSKFLNTRIILMTATKPKIFELAQQEILEKEGDKVEPFELLKSNKEIFALFKRTKIVPLLDEKFNDCVAKEFLENIFSIKWDTSKSCLIVCNTVNRSIEIYNSISEYLVGQELENPVHYLSTNIIPAHRAEGIKLIKSEIQGRKAPILISTQVVEAGVDLDFDMGFRDLGPIDSIIQVAGRINRNNNPEKYHSPLYVLDFGDASKIYGQITAIQARSALQTNIEFKEETYFNLINSYFNNVASKSSFSKFNKIFESMKTLRYDGEVTDDERPVSSFRIIEESQFTASVFIEFDDYSAQLRDYYFKKITGKITKEFFEENFKTAFQQRIITVPNYIAVGLNPINEYDESLLVVEQEVVNDYYNEKTGFIRQHSNSIYML
ncbi:MAG: CRISPR-associated helicase Cas3' [Draconibacterium sp.]